MRRVALITGGSRGIGLGIAQHLAKNGFDIAINGVRDASAVSEVVASLKNSGVEAIYCQGSISSSEDQKKIIQQVKNHFGIEATLINNINSI